MNFLEEKILQDGVIKEGNILKVDSFLNHQIDIDIMRQMAYEFKRRFRDVQVNKVLTIEASGIAIATLLGPMYDVPVVFAKKSQTANSTDDKYVSQAYSFTHKKMNNVFISKPYLNAGDKVMSSANADIKPGNTLPMANIPVGTYIHNIELHPGKGGQLVRAAGAAAQLMAKENGKATVRLPSGEYRYIALDCKATIGQIGNIEHGIIKVGKAGKTRHKGIRPTVRGSVMNPNDHPHGGGEGKAPVGRPGPVTPWGKPALGYKTRAKKARTEKNIVKHRNGK